MNVENEITLYVHIGYGKTGSSSIQKTLKRNGDFLKNNAAFYIGLMGELLPGEKYSWQIPFGWGRLLKLGETGIKELKAMLLDNMRILKDEGVEKVIWSNESFLKSPLIVIDILKFLKENGVNIQVIAYVRRHDAWARSAYLQWGLKHKTYRGKVKSFKEWVKSNTPDFYGYLSQWVELDWGNTVVRNFDCVENVTDDFIQLLDLKGDYLNCRDNDTPSSTALYLWALYNNQYERQVLPGELYGFLVSHGIIGTHINELDYCSLFPSANDLEEVVKNSERDRVQVNSVLREQGQEALSDIPLEEKNYNVTQSQINAVFLNVIKKQQEEIASIKEILLRNNISI
ncbi:hypothetical protein [Amphritea pacifica]|uniref:hypothetical protein n=1 Tax=Amphritea pacifica TaxID=2811233 RepID=UPI0019627FEB|nr:hypothetical protein [Amphritea pacifica]MBN1008310.1 hypothetical protein [Amphritea pacifica]